MTETVIQAEGLGKRYRLRHEAAPRYRSLREDLAAGLRRLAGLGQSGPAMPETGRDEEFWALRDVSFEVKQGEVVGIIGRNGAGKSTLLKILSRITESTEGRVHISGRVASLLEVGTGFHPELTGRENIYLNGVILGMSRAEVRRRFDEIAAFAEVERFLDTPVKHYSSGMYVRLAFSVAAHLDPEILIVDEVLAVGDAEFQKKCLGKMRSVSAGGRTVIFVSHQMVTVQNLCQRGLLLSQGRVIRAGPIAEVVRHYLTEATHLAEFSLENRPDREGSGVLRFAGVSLLDAMGQPLRSFTCGAPAVMELMMSSRPERPLRTVRVAVGIDNHEGARILNLSTHLASEDFSTFPSGAQRVRLHVPRMTLAPGRYVFTLYSSVGGETADWVVNAGSFEVENGDFYGSGQLPPAGPGQGCMLMDHTFELSRGTARDVAH